MLCFACAIVVSRDLSILFPEFTGTSESTLKKHQYLFLSQVYILACVNKLFMWQLDVQFKSLSFNVMPVATQFCDSDIRIVREKKIFGEENPYMRLVFLMQ